MSCVVTMIKKVGKVLTSVALLIFTISGPSFLIYEFIELSKPFWNAVLNNWKDDIIYLIMVTTIVILLVASLISLLGEIGDFFFSKYDSIIREKIEYSLSESEKDKITVIIPAYNEEKTIREAIESVRPFCKNVIVIDDGSTDNTRKIAEECGTIIVPHNINKGLGMSLKDGVNKALEIGAEIIVNFDADLQYDPNDIPMLVYYILHENYDLVMGSRLAGTIEKMPPLKKFGNKMYTKLLRYLTGVGISDGQTGYRAFTANFARSIKIRGDFTYTQEMILEAAKIKAKIGEIPIYFSLRKDGESRLMKSALHFAKASGVFLIKILVELKPLYVYGLICYILAVIGATAIGVGLMALYLNGALAIQLSFLILGFTLIGVAINTFLVALLFGSINASRESKPL